MFDIVEIRVVSGRGGDGAVSFRREKFVPFGGPDGGDGGGGGNVVVRADPAVSSVGGYWHKRRYRAGHGMAGGGQKKHGRQGEDMVLPVPLGTVVLRKTQVGSDSVIADLTEPGQQVVVAQGGRGGWGNARFATPTNQTPRLAQRGEDGEENDIILELRLIADVGIIGYPSVGKSTLLAAASAAKPKIDSYPFTTRSPVLGVVEVGSRTFVMAEIPGLMADAHMGRGLGHEFLRHVSRTRLLIHLVDGTAASPLADMRVVNTELELYDSALARKRQIVVVNKVDLPEVHSRLPGIEGEFAAYGVKAFFISAATGEGVVGLMAEVMEMLDEEVQRALAPPRAPVKVFRPTPRAARVAVRREGETFVVSAPELERVIARVDKAASLSHRQLKPYLERLGMYKALVRSGVKRGDRVRCGHWEWEWE